MSEQNSRNTQVPPPPRLPPAWARRRLPTVVFGFAASVMLAAAALLAWERTPRALFPVAFACVFVFMAWREGDRRRLLSLGEVTDGVVTQNWISKGSATILYSYSAHGQGYQGRFALDNCTTKRVFGSLNLDGVRVLVVFDPARPSRSVLWGKA